MNEQVHGALSARKRSSSRSRWAWRDSWPIRARTAPGGAAIQPRRAVSLEQACGFADQADDCLTEDDFRTHSRAKLHELLLDASRNGYPAVGPKERSTTNWTTAWTGTSLSEPEDARELAEWMRSELKLEIARSSADGVDRGCCPRSPVERLRSPAIGRKCGPMERSLFLNQLDTSWKNHLYTMDHLRSGIGLMRLRPGRSEDRVQARGHEGIRHDVGGIQDKVTDAVFRMEEEEAFQESVWSIGADDPRECGAAPRLHAQSARRRHHQQPDGDKKPEPIRNRGEQVGRNDPCPCGSGKKYKNCHMRQAVG